MPPPANPKIYHIVHVDKLASIAADGCLWSDAELAQRPVTGTVIGMNNIKARRMNELTLASHPGLYVGQCVPFYFCPRSIMLYMIHMRNAELAYQGGQDEIVHLVSTMDDAIAWAEAEQRRWAFTLSNAGSRDFEDRADRAAIGEVNWDAVVSIRWSGGTVDPSIKRGKQAEFLIERSFPWQLVRGIGAKSEKVALMAAQAIAGTGHQMTIKSKPKWYY
jgi:ssDNA thymidine ADP-ribosyltransferase, DarT